MVSDRRTLSYLVVAGVFSLGAITGAAASRAYTQREYAELVSEEHVEVREGRRVRALTEELRLDPDQQERIRTILNAHREKRRELGRELFERCGQPLKAYRSQVDAEIRTLLRPEQQQRFDELLERRNERFGRGRWRGRGGRRHDKAREGDGGS